MTATNKRYSYPRVAVIRIDVYSTGKNPTNTTHTQSTYGPRVSRGQHIAIFHEVVNRFVQIHCTQEEWLSTQSTARHPSDLRVRTQLLSHNNQWGSGEKTNFCWQPATRLTGPITPICDRYIQYLLAGANSSVLNWHRRGLQSWRCQLFTYHSSTFPIVGLQFNHNFTN
jgi:hypothetical protein